MNREQMVETAAGIVSCWQDKGRVDDIDRDGARELLDAILPQVTTVEELEALHIATKLIVGRNGAVVSIMRRFEFEGGGRYYAVGHGGTIEWDAATLLKYADGPLTVVWRPES